METNPTWLPTISICISVIAVVVTAIIAWNSMRTLRRDALKQAEVDGRWKGEVDVDRGLFKTFMEEVKKELREIAKNIKTLREAWIERYGRQTIGPGSPLRLTDLGKEISEELKALSWARKTAELIKNDLLNLDPYTIQESCLEHAIDSENYSSEENTAIRNSAYERGLDVHQVRRVFGIELRDIILAEAGKTAP